jgi:quinol monooxygenase YgiN
VSVVVVATITPKPGQLDAVRAAIMAAVPKVHAEPGCELYAVHEGRGHFVMVERWETHDALKAHGAAEALTTLGAQLADKLEGAPDVRRLTALPAGDPVKGAIR